ncbi:MAG: DNA polymerase III subunit gamma/tau [Syntrophorhabdales bacterium]
MSYTVIARRWRPRKFDDVVGQAHIVTTLKNSIRRGRIAHAYLFCGPRGVGKTSISRILAKAVNCVEGVKEEPCNACRTCSAIDGGGYVDVIEIDAASNRGIDEIRELRETVRYLPMEGRYKVYIIDEAHMLTEPAFNALLKTLEEPPGHNIFILATTESQKIPYTIMSRCQRFDFRRISESQIVEQLTRICLDEGIECDEKVLNYVVREADGSLRDAESILDQVIAYSGARISEGDVIDVIGVVQREVAYGIVKCIIEKDPREGLSLIARTLEEGHDVYQIYKGLLSFLRDVLMIKVCNGKPPFVFMDDEEYGRAEGLTKEVEYYEIQNMVHHMLKAEDLIRGIFPKVSLEILFINLYNLSRLRDVEAMIEAAGGSAAQAEGVPETRGRGGDGGTLGKDMPPAGRNGMEKGRHDRAEAVAEPPSPIPDQDTPVQDGPHQDAVAQDTPAQDVPVQDGPSAGPGDLVSYLKEKSKMLFGIFSSLDMRAEEDRLTVSLGRDSVYIRDNGLIINEFKEHASAFFGREMTVRFVDGGSETEEETLDDYVREAERLFKV